MAHTISMNFQFVKPEEAKVSVMDRSFLYGDSVYEVIRTYHRTQLFLFDRHYTRLLRSAAHIGMEIPFSAKELEKHLQNCIEISKNSESYIRIVVSRGTDTRFGLIPSEGVRSTTVVFVEPLPELPKSYYSEGIPVSLVSIRRNLRTAVDPNAKTGNYMNNMLALMEAHKAKSVEAIMLNYEGNVTEGTTSNVFIVKRGVVQTPEVASGLLEGVSRALLKEMMGREKISFQEKAISQKEFLVADEIFITGTIKELIPVVHVNGKPVGQGKPGPVTRQLMELWRKATA